jgi:hypothetical protein
LIVIVSISGLVVHCLVFVHFRPNKIC